jgi:putative peptidoglycan lipid II flippase
MIKRALSMFYNRSSGINEAAFLLGIFTLISQLLGLVRDRLLATYLGAGAHLDVYYAAFKIPDFLFVSVASLASITVLLPFLSQKYKDGANDDYINARNFFDQVFTVLLVFLVAVSVLLFIIMPWLARLVAPGFGIEETKTLIMLSRIMLLQPIIIGISNMLSSVTQMFKKFLITALSPVMYNIGIIIGIVILYPHFGIKGLAYGVILGACLHFIIQIPTLISIGFVPRFTTNIRFSELIDIVKTSIPRTLGLSMSTLTALMLTSIASTLDTGSISLFNLTNNMLNVPIGVIAISYSVASFPVLVKFFHEKERGKFVEYMVNATRKIIFLSVPITVLFIVLRAQIIRVILGSHSFSWNDTRLAAASLAVFVIGLVAQSLVHLFVRGYYAAGNTKKPLIMNFAGELITIAFAFLFIFLFNHVYMFSQFFVHILRLEGVTNITLLALPLAFALGNIVNYFLLLRVFRVDFPEVHNYSIINTTIQTLIGSLVMGVVTYGILNILPSIIRQETFGGIFLQGLLAGSIGIIAFSIVMILLKNEEMLEFKKTMQRKFWKANIVIDQSAIDN